MICRKYLSHIVMATQKNCTYVFAEYDECIELWCQLKHESCVVPENTDVSFIASVEEYGASLLPPFIYLMKQR